MAKRCTKISAGQICHMQYNISSFQVSPGFGSGEYNVSEGSGSVAIAVVKQTSAGIATSVQLTTMGGSATGETIKHYNYTQYIILAPQSVYDEVQLAVGCRHMAVIAI